MPTGLKGSTLDRNFKEIKETCGYHYNGHNRTNSQVIPFVITLPFTILFHAIAFLVTATFYLLRILRIEEMQGGKLPDPVNTSIFISNTLISSFWFLGGTRGIVFATLTIIFNQKAFNSLLFKKNLKDFFISLIFGNLLVVDEKMSSSVTEIALSEKRAAFDLEEGVKNTKAKDKVDEGIQYSPASLPPVRYLPPLLGVSTSSSTNSLVDKDMASPENYSSVTPPIYSKIVKEKIVVEQNGEEEAAIDVKEESPMDIFVDEIASQHSNEALQHIVTVESTPRKFEEIACLENDEECDQRNEVDIETRTERVETSRKLSKKGLLDLSRRIFSSPRSKYMHSKAFNLQQQDDDDEVSVEFLDPTDVHFDIENHPGTLEWRNAISESIQKFHIKSYTLRKHNWVMSQMHGKSFYVNENGNRRRKLKRKEIKECCKVFHDKQVHVNSQIFGILDDLKNLRKNISHSKSSSVNHSKSNSVSHSKSNSEHTKFTFTNMPSKANEKPGRFANVTSTGEKSRENKEVYAMIDAKYKTPKSDAASTAKESHVGSKDSSVSTLTQSYIDSEHPENTRSSLCMDGVNGKILQPNGDSATFKDAINGLLRCSPWIENINSLKQNASKEENGSEQIDSTDVQNTTRMINASKSAGQPQCEASENHLENEKGKPKESSTATLQQCLPILFDVPEIFTPNSEDKPKDEQSSWRSDLQKKKIEKAREDRSQSKKIAVKETKFLVAPWQTGQTATDSSRNSKTVVEENLNESGGDDRHEIANDSRGGVDNEREFNFKYDDGIVDNSTSWINSRSPSVGDPEMSVSPSKFVHKMSNFGLGRECDVFDGISDACSHLSVSERREEEDFRSYVRHISTDRVV